MAQTEVCRKCGTQRPAVSPGNLCPGCLMRLGLAADDPDEDAAALDGNAPGDRTAGANGASEPGRPLETVIELVDLAPLENGATERPAPLERLELLGEIARGGVGVVLLGRDHTLARDLAVKILQEKHRDRPAMVRRFFAEARIAGQLQHPGIVPVHELGTLPDERPYFTMKLVKGKTLAEVLAESQGSPADRRSLLPVFLQVVQTIAYAHNHGVIHLDLKPANIMLGKYGEVRVMDWGLARTLTRGSEAPPPQECVNAGAIVDDREAGASPLGRFMGTPGYMAPEQFSSGEADLDECTDVFALGAILFEILTGRPIFGGASARNCGATRSGATFRWRSKPWIDAGQTTA